MTIRRVRRQSLEEVAGSMIHSRRSIKSKYSMNQGAKIKEITVYGAQVIGWLTGIASTAYGQ